MPAKIFLPLCGWMLLSLFPLRGACDEPVNAKPAYGFEAGKRLPLLVVDFLSGPHKGSSGCPAVMVRNQRTRGVVICSRAPHARLAELAQALEAQAVDGEKLHGFLVGFEAAGGELAELCHERVTKFNVAKARKTADEWFEFVHLPPETACAVCLIDQQIKNAWTFASADLTPDQIDEIVRAAAAVAAGSEGPGNPAAAATPAPDDLSQQVSAARERGLDWLTKNQAADGSWGQTYTTAVTGFACLSYLSASDDPYTGERGRALIRGLNFILSNQQDGTFAQQGHTWIHVQGFATLALSEAYGRSLLAQTKPDIDTGKIRDVVARAVEAIAANQSSSGGWWYTPGAPGSHEGSTTVCAVQALVSADNYGIKIDKGVLARGFEYLKQCQNEDGGFDYQLGDAVSMKEGTAAGVATLGLMKKFDYLVMINGYKFLLNITPATISAERFPYYGHFYGAMGMQLLGQEFKNDKEFRENTQGYIAAVQKELLAWQEAEGAWPVKAFMVGQENSGFATAFATLALHVPEARLSIYNRTPPKLAK